MDINSDFVHRTAPLYALKAMEILKQSGKQAFAVGGFVRDALLGVAPHDVDLATDALWYVTRDIFQTAGYHVIETGVDHGTVTVLFEDQKIEITTFRTEGPYLDHRRPASVKYVCDVRDDLARRDFTMNAIAWNSDEGIVDPFGGMDDIASKTIRAVGVPSARFEEDALRVMRAVRFRSQLGFEIDAETSAAVHDHAPDISHVSVERVAAEYNKLVCGPFACSALREFPDVAARAVSGIQNMVGFDQRSKWHCYDVWEHCLHALEALPPDAPSLVRHVTLLHDIGKPDTFVFGQDGNGHFTGHEEVGSRLFREAYRHLKWPASELKVMEYLVRRHDMPLDACVEGVRRHLSEIAAYFAGSRQDALMVFECLLMLKYADTITHAPGATGRRLDEIARASEAFGIIKRDQLPVCVGDLTVKGGDIVSLGVSPGPVVGNVLKSLLASVISGEVKNDRSALLERAQMFLQ